MKLFPFYDTGHNTATTGATDLSGSTDYSFSSDGDEDSTTTGIAEVVGSTSPTTKNKAAAIMAGATAAAASPRTVRFDLDSVGGGAQADASAAMSKKLMQAQADLAGERTLRRRKEKTIVKLAKELNRRILDGEKKDKKIRELTRLLEEEHKLESVLTVASSLLGGSRNRSSSSSSVETGSPSSMEIRKQLMMGDQEPQTKHLVAVSAASRKIRAATGCSILLAIAAAVAAWALHQEGIGVFALPNTFAW